MSRIDFQGICYSGYRTGQSPDTGPLPSPTQIEEDLRILARRWRRIRLYDAGPHAELVLAAIRRLGLDMEVLLGAWLAAEVNNPQCGWGAWYPEEQLQHNRVANAAEVERAIDLARRYPELITALAAGNEATVSWTGQLVPVHQVIEYVRRLKAAVPQPVTFCENHVPWVGHLDALAAELDFLSVHSYPVWEYKGIDEAMAATEADWQRVTAAHPGKPVIITEAGWTTRSNGRGIEPHNARDDLQARYYGELTRWGQEHNVLVYVFEAFDEPWKGSPDPNEPEKHWGLFTVDRRPKPVMHQLYSDLLA
jgi:exo-beta-1,3-glucanase (GH17 family)